MEPSSLTALLERVDLLKSASHILSLNSKISLLEGELEASKQNLSSATEQVERLQKLYDQSQTYNLDLRKQIATFSIELMQYKQIRASEGDVTFSDCATQTEDVSEQIAPKVEVTEEISTAASELPQESSVSIADSLKMAAESVVQQSGFAYDESTGMYFDQNSGYYYDSESCLYYEPNSGVYYEFNADTQQYVYHSQVDIGDLRKQMKFNERMRKREEEIERKKEDERKREERKKKSDDRRDEERRRDDDRDSRRRDEDRRRERRHERRSNSRERERKRHRRDRSEERDRKHRRRDRDHRRDRSVEDGEVSSDSDGHSPKSKESKDDIDEELAAQYLPMVRAIVTKSNCLDEGHMAVITCTGSTIGRATDLGHAVVISEPEVSKMHCSIKYDSELQRYVVTDQASQIGTYVNGQRIGEAREISVPKTIYNEDKLKIGTTEFDLHIHRGTTTCDGCEPGLLQSKIAAEKRAEALALDRESNRRQQLKNIKKKYGLKDAEYVDDNTAINNPKYEDKASHRRKTVGSDNPYLKDEAPASVNKAISTENKGHKMLAKMGWKEGQSLGKTETSGIVEPVQVNQRAKATAGLGAYSEFESSMGAATSDVKQKERLLKTQERYMKLEQEEKLKNVKVKQEDN